MSFSIAHSSQTALGDVDFLSRFRWRVCVVDEAHRLKNPQSALYKTLQAEYVLLHKYVAPYRFEGTLAACSA